MGHKGKKSVMFRMVVLLMNWRHYEARKARWSDVYDFRRRVFEYRRHGERRVGLRVGEKIAAGDR
jgi:hypothetical protein